MRFFKSRVATNNVAQNVEVAMPQLIDQDDLSMDYVNKWKRETEGALKRNNHISSHKLENRNFPLLHWERSANTGVWFVSVDGKSLDYLYAYKSISLGKKPRAAEALAYVFTPNGRGLMPKVFYNHLLPYSKFVVTDYMYTPKVHDWFEAEYNEAFGRGYKVYAIDLTNKFSMKEITKEEFDELQPLYWGQTTKQQKYRFAIELPN